MVIKVNLSSLELSSAYFCFVLRIVFCSAHIDFGFANIGFGFVQHWFNFQCFELLLWLLEPINKINIPMILTLTLVWQTNNQNHCTWNQYLSFPTLVIGTKNQNHWLYSLALTLVSGTNNQNQCSKVYWF